MQKMPMPLTAAAALIVLFFVLHGLTTQVAVAQDTGTPPVIPVTDDQVNAIAKTLYCPVCENITLDTCGTAACADWRYEIRLQLEAGRTTEEIREDFVRRFGDRVVGTPLDPVLRALSLALPYAAAVLGLAAAVFVVVRLTRRTDNPATRLAASAVAETAPRTDYADQIERDLAGDRL
ncbi:MAG: cytochrome c-type biogenesis protein CcmH [Anaerolineae bacterium]|nr:cytochrome c-type biogenesis protein CcmH [Anaerolineae bacterium]